MRFHSTIYPRIGNPNNYLKQQGIGMKPIFAWVMRYESPEFLFPRLDFGLRSMYIVSIFYKIGIFSGLSASFATLEIRRKPCQRRGKKKKSRR
jgi:hypothetical protein